jgi:hypothetical protein
MMLRYLTSTLGACALAGSVSVLAQEQSPAPQQQAPNAQQQAPDAQQQPPSESASKTTLTGCVVQAKTTDGSPVYVLDTGQEGPSRLTVLLGSSEMPTNVNKKVEVTGPVQQPSAPAGDEASKDGAAASQKVLRPPMMQVESVKVVADSCT